MKGQEALLSGLQLLENSPSLELLVKSQDVYSEVKESYVQEFGLAWTLKEINEARGHIQRTSGRGIGIRVGKLFEAADKSREGNFVGTRSFSPEQFRLYVKGLYWLAGYLIIKENRNL